MCVHNWFAPPFFPLSILFKIKLVVSFGTCGSDRCRSVSVPSGTRASIQLNWYSRIECRYEWTWTKLLCVRNVRAFGANTNEIRSFRPCGGRAYVSPPHGMCVFNGIGFFVDFPRRLRAHPAHTHTHFPRWTVWLDLFTMGIMISILLLRYYY